MTIYIDVVLIENIIMNYIILYATAIIYKTKAKTIRLFLSSLIGAIYAILSYLNFINTSCGILVKFILSISMVYIAFNAQSAKSLMKQLLVFYLASFVFGGIAFALLYFVKPQDILIKNGIYIGTYPIKIVFLGAILGFIAIRISFKIIKGSINKKDLICKIKIRIFNNKFETKALVDTGNLLKEPITGASVIVVEKETMRNILPDEILNNLDNILKGEYTENIGEFCTKLRAIPFSSLGKTNGMILGIKPDEVVVETEEKEITVNNAIIGIYNSYLTKNGSYTALIGFDLLEGSEKNEFIGIAEK